MNPDPPRPAASSAAGWAVLVAVFAVGFALFPLRVVGVGFDHLPGDLIDARLNNYVLEHGYRWLTGRDPAFWDAGFFYPAKRIVAYSDAHIGTLPVYAAFRAAGLSPEAAFRGWFLVPFLLNYAACVWAVRRFGWGPVAAAAGAYLFAFGLPLATCQTQHAQLGPRFLVPPALVLGWEWAWNPSARRLGWLAACVVGQAYLTLYVGYFLALVLLLQWMVVAVCFRRSLPWDRLLRPGRRAWLGRLGIAAAAGAALLPLFVPHALAGQEHGHYPLATIRDFCPTPRSWLTPSRIAWHRDWTDEVVPVPADTPYSHEKELFPGLVPVAAWLAGLVVLFRRPAAGSRAAVVGASAAVVMAGVALTTRVGGVAAYDPLLHLPGVPGMRTVSRVVLVLLFPLGVLVAAATEELMRLAGRWGWACGVGMLGLLVADQWVVSPTGPRAADWAKFRTPEAEAVARRERLAAVIRRHPDPRVVYFFPDPQAPEEDWLIRQLDAMCTSQQLGLPTVNGWSGYWPREWEIFTDYAGLLRWLARETGEPVDRLTGLVVVGEPTGGDPSFEREMRARFPPLPAP